MLGDNFHIEILKRSVKILEFIFEFNNECIKYLTLL